ncbi:hypothetical protein DYB28_011418, partial [Aphanomyces astaci]
MFDFGKSHGDVTEDEWVSWFMEAHDEEPVELDALKKRLQVAVQFDTKILDADSRVSRMLDNLMKTLEADGQEWVLHQEGKLVVGIITKAIKPAPLQLAVTKQLQLQRNKVLKSDVFRYVKWLRQFAIGYQLYGGMDEERPSKAPAEEPRKENSRPRLRFSPVPEEKRPSGASVAPPTWRADRRDEPPERPKPKCLKCQSTAHRVREHPGITDAKVKKLMDDFHQARRRAVNFVSSTKPANSMECQASIEDVLTLPKVLLDSGSDETLVSEGLLVALERLGASLNVETKPMLMLKPYGETTKPLHVTRQVQFKTVTLETSIGPLVLRGLRAWVEEKRMEIDVLIGRPVMERLGFSVDGMLVDALKQRRVWDMAEAGDADQTSANVKRLQEAFQEDPEDALYAEDVACSTPAMEKPADQDGEIKRIRETKTETSRTTDLARLSSSQQVMSPSMSSYKSPVVLLNEDNWNVWRTYYRGRLMSKGLWYIMSGSPPPSSRGNESSAATDTRTLADDEKAYGLLIESIETSQYQYIEHATTANAAYTALSDHHEPKTKVDRLALLSDFYGMSWNMKQEPLPEFLARYDVVLRKLRDSDQSITSGMAVDRLLQLMPWELRH